MVELSETARSKPKKPIDLWLWLIALAVTIFFFLIPKTPISVVLCAVALFAALIHPLWNFWWIEDYKGRQILATLLLASVCSLIAYAAWPSIDRASLKQRAQELSRDLLDFVGERQRADPSYEMHNYSGLTEDQKNAEWQRTTERSIQYSVETNRQYETKFGPRVLAIKDEFARLGIKDKDLDAYAEHPTNPIGMRTVAVRIGVLAEELQMQ